nr:DNA adenine methylase [Anaerotruncus rubiinfantis]
MPWVGGKGALRKLIYRLFPSGYKKYVEVFGGGGSVLFGRKHPQKCMEIYNDANGDLVNLFYCVKNKPLALLAELGFLPLHARDEFKILKKFLKKEEFTDDDLKEELELAEHFLPPPDFEEIRILLAGQAALRDVRRAAAYYKLIRYSYGGGGNSYGARPLDIRRGFHLIWECSRRLAEVVIEHKDFEALIETYDSSETLFYIDPPYFEAECYEVEFSLNDHYRLMQVLSKCEGMWVLSYNDCPFIRNLYAGYRIYPVRRLNNMAQRYESGKEYPEVIILNYDPKEYAKENPIQMTLFQSDQEDEDEYDYVIANEQEELT